MYNKILVPLDGSKLAECVLPHVESIAGGCAVPDVIFLRVVEPVHLPAGTLSDGASIFTEEQGKQVRMAIDAEHKSTAERYLNQLISQLQGGGANLQSEVIIGKAAEGIAEYAAKNGVDLIIIATHGRSGISRWVMGSVAERVLRAACVPVLMVRAPGCVPGI